MNIPDSINFDQLTSLARTASSGITAMDPDELFALCNELTGELNHLIDQLDDCVAASIPASRWEHIETARKSLKIARRNLKAAIKS